MRRWSRLWWILLTLAPFGWLTWAAFLFAALRTKRYRWLGIAALFLAVIPIELMASDVLAAWLMIGAWIAGPVVALVIRREYLRRSGADASAASGRPKSDTVGAAERRPHSMDREPKPSFMLRNAFMRRVVMPLFALCVFGFGPVSAWEAVSDFSPRLVALAFVFTSVGLTMLYGIAAAEQRYGRYRMPPFLQPRLRHSIRTRSAGGMNEYELRTPAAARLVIGGTIASLFLLPHLEWEPPLWVTLALATLGTLAATPVLRGGRSLLRIGHGRLEFEGNGARVTATAWETATVRMHGSPMTYVFLADGDAEIASNARLLHFTNSMFGENVEEMLNVQPFVDAARRTRGDVEQALRRDLELGVRDESATRNDEPPPTAEHILSHPPGATAGAAGAR